MAEEKEYYGWGYEDGEAVIRKFNEKEGIGGSKFFLCRDYQYISLNESGHCDPVLTIMGPVAQFFPSKEKPRKNAYNVLVHGFNGTFRISSDLISIATVYRLVAAEKTVANSLFLKRADILEIYIL